MCVRVRMHAKCRLAASLQPCSCRFSVDVSDQANVYPVWLSLQAVFCGVCGLQVPLASQLTAS